MCLCVYVCMHMCLNKCVEVRTTSGDAGFLFIHVSPGLIEVKESRLVVSQLEGSLKTFFIVFTFHVMYVWQNSRLTIIFNLFKLHNTNLYTFNDTAKDT